MNRKKTLIGRFALLLAGILPLQVSCIEGLVPVMLGILPANFHVLEDGRAYRSSQPTPEALASAIELFGIRTVVNLRGTNHGKEWYDEETAVCEAMGVTHVDHAMSAQSLPSAELLGAIINTLQTAEYPILIHCQMGADRAGAISVIYRMLIMGHDKVDALQELSPAYFHYRVYAPCMDTLAEMYETDPGWLAEYAAVVDETVCTP